MGHSAGADASCSDILSLLRDRAAAHPERPAIEEADGEVLTYVALLARTEGLAAALRLRGNCAPGMNPSALDPVRGRADEGR